MNSYNIFWFFVAACAAAAPIPLIKMYTKTNEMYWIWLSIVSYATLIYAYSIILLDRNITIVYPILKVLSVLIVIGAGIVLFYNRLNLRSAVGILLGILSIYLLSKEMK